MQKNISYPQFKDKYLEESLFFPSDFLNYKGLKGLKLPSNYILTYQPSALRYFKKEYSGKYKLFKLHHNCFVYYLDKINLGFLFMQGFGSPNAGILFEDLIALGLKNVINVGTAGGLQSEGVFLCDRAIRDEGTSFHYLPFGVYSYPDESLTKKLAESLKDKNINFNLSTTWTIDAPYRETKKEIAHYKSQGVATVEMEASALFAIAKVRNVKIASVFVVSDILGEKWNPKFDHINVIKTQNLLVDSAIDCLSKLS